jgi:hypothetical protein
MRSWRASCGQRDGTPADPTRCFTKRARASGDGSMDTTPLSMDDAVHSLSRVVTRISESRNEPIRGDLPRSALPRSWARFAPSRVLGALRGCARQICWRLRCPLSRSRGVTRGEGCRHKSLLVLCRVGKKSERFEKRGLFASSPLAACLPSRTNEFSIDHRRRQALGIIAPRVGLLKSMSLVSAVSRTWRVGRDELGSGRCRGVHESF